MKSIKFAILLIAVLLFAGCAKTHDVSTLYPNKSEAQIFHDGEHLMLKGDYSKAVKHFEVLDARYPFGRYSRQAQLDIIYAYYKKNDIPSALAAVDRYIKLYPTGPYIDYAYYMRGLIRFNQNHGFFEKYFPTDFAKRDLTTMRQAYADFSILLHYFPRSKYAPDARIRLRYIRNIMSRHELQVAEFYFKHDAYVAAANRASEVVRFYQKTPSVPQALAVMVRSYRKLNLAKNANDALRVLQTNYPNSKELQYALKG
ncbi:MAG: outer membrane protein assembly factor BamD [Gammaproteobacteria bacterium]